MERGLACATEAARVASTATIVAPPESRITANDAHPDGASASHVHEAVAARPLPSL
jgi:hypothetical protein